VAALRVTYRNRVLGGLTLSLGVAFLPDHGESAEELLRAADKALYRAKQSGRNQALIAVADDTAAKPVEMPVAGFD
jgi:diguanylate cyclase (GGDEF)-like protein